MTARIAGPREMGQVVRMGHQIQNLIGLIAGLEQSIAMGVPCSEAAHAVADAAGRLVAHAAAHDAYQRTEPDIAALIEYSDRAKVAAGEDRVGGEPLADTITRLRTRAAELQDRIDGLCETCQERCPHGA